MIYIKIGNHENMYSIHIILVATLTILLYFRLEVLEISKRERLYADV